MNSIYKSITNYCRKRWGGRWEMECWREDELFMYQITPELRERPIVFLKFAKEKWIFESFREGNLYMNTIDYYRKLEEETKKRGMGDKDEGALILTQLDISLFDYETGNFVLSGFAGKSALRSKEDTEKHAFCLGYLDFNNLEITEEGSNYIRTKTFFTEELKQEFKENFGEHVLMFSCGNFIENIRKTFERENILWAADKIKYSDFSINYIDRIESYMNGGSDRFFWKDNYFKNQQEYRIVVVNRDSNEPLQINIGDMSNYSHLTTSDELFGTGFGLEMHFDPKKHLVEMSS